MADQYLRSKRPVRQALKRIAIAVLFLLVLIIPALRRLRRRVWVWTGIRVLAAGAGGWLISRFADATASASALVAGIVLILFGLALRAGPQTPSLDSKAQDLRALVVVNGGTFRYDDGGKQIRHVHLFVISDRVVALAKAAKPLVEIPFSSIRDLSADAVSQEKGRKRNLWNLNVTWQSAELTTTRFCYEGVFAEHLARVAEQTLRSLWKKELPVLRV
jgi:hypothetical protein